MKSIRNRRDGYALLFAASILLAIWHCITFMLKEVIFFAAISCILLMLPHNVQQ